MEKQKQDELGVYAIYDKKSEKYDTPFLAYSDLFAKRRFMIMMDEDKSPLNKWPEDFRLDKLANVSIKDGKVYSEYKILIEAKSIIREIKNEK